MFFLPYEMGLLGKEKAGTGGLSLRQSLLSRPFGLGLSMALNKSLPPTPTLGHSALPLAHAVSRASVSFLAHLSLW